MAKKKDKRDLRSDAVGKQFAELLEPMLMELCAVCKREGFSFAAIVHMEETESVNHRDAHFAVWENVENCPTVQSVYQVACEGYAALPGEIVSSMVHAGMLPAQIVGGYEAAVRAGMVPGCHQYAGPVPESIIDQLKGEPEGE